jgi:hypothetical protein
VQLNEVLKVMREMEEPQSLVELKDKEVELMGDRHVKERVLFRRRPHP